MQKHSAQYRVWRAIGTRGGTATQIARRMNTNDDKHRSVLAGLLGHHLPKLIAAGEVTRRGKVYRRKDTTP